MQNYKVIIDGKHTMDLRNPITQRDIQMISKAYDVTYKGCKNFSYYPALLEEKGINYLFITRKNSGKRGNGK